jgi:site-specific DNA recombinase
MEVAFYVRVSTSRQQQQQTIDQQLSRLRDYIVTHPDWHVAEEHIYRDDGYSGATLNRPGLDRLRDRAAMAAFECILITAPDRLARNYVHQMLLVDELTQRGCRVEFVERPMSDDPHDQLLLQIRSAVAEYERTLIAERMRRGRQAKLRSGQLLPWTRAPYGYLLDPDRPRDASRVQIDPVQAAVVAQMFAWYTDPGQSVSLYAVAKRLSDAQIPPPRGGKRWNVASIRGILRSPAYTGMAYSGRTRPAPARRRKSALQPVGPGQSQQPTAVEEWIAVPVPAIISQETFEAAQSRLDRNVQMARRNNTTYEYLLRGLVSCGQCRLACSGRTLSPGYHYYFCRGRTDSLRLAQGERCTARYAPAHALDALVWQDLCRVLREPRLITHELERAQMGEWLPQALHARRQTLRDVLAQLERQQARLLDLYLAEVIEREEFERRRKEVTQTQHGLRQQLRQLDAQAQQHVNVAALAQGIETFCQRMQSTLNNLTFAQRRQLVALLIDCVIVNDTQVEIRYVVPTGPKGETAPFCHLRLDYLDLETCSIQLHQLAAVQGQLRRGQHDIARLGGRFPVDHDHEAQLAFERDMPDDGRIEMQMGCLRHGAEGRKAAEVLKIDFAIVFTPCPATLWVWAGVEKPTVGIAPQLGNRVQVETDRFIQVLLLRKVTVHAMIGDLRRQAVTLLTQLLAVKIHSGLFLGLLRDRLVIARRCLGHCEGEGAAACHIHDGQRGDFQAAFGPGGTAVEEVPETERLLATLRDEGSVLRRDHFRARVEGDRDDPLMEVWPVKVAPELPCYRALTIVAVATQIAKVDAASQCQDGREQRVQELGLGLTDRRHPL